MLNLRNPYFFLATCFFFLFLNSSCFALQLSEMLKLSGITDQKTIDCLHSYSKKEKHKAIAIDPISLNWRSYWSQRSKQKAVAMTLKSPNVLLFAADSDYVWSENVKSYLHGDLYKGRMLLEQGNYEGALSKFNNCLSAEYVDWNIYYNLGLLYVELGDYDNAINNFLKVLTHNEDQLESINQLFELYLITNRPDLAKPFMSKVNNKSSLFKYMKYLYFAAINDFKSASDSIGKTPTVGMTIKENDKGIEVVRVMPNCPAALAGLQKGDRIIAYNGGDVKGMSTSQFVDVIKSVKLGSTTSLLFVRDSKIYQSQIISGITYNYLEDSKLLKPTKLISDNQTNGTK